MARNHTTRPLVVDYVLHRLRMRGLEWPANANYPDLLPAEGNDPGPVKRTMRVLGEEFEQRYNEVFTEMCNQLHITPANAQATFVTIVNQLFSDGVRWGRIVALFAFTGCLAVQCVEREMPLLVDQVVEWTTSYIEVHLDSWIIENGGWDSFVSFYENGNPEQRNESPWPSLKTLCGYAVGALGVLTLGAILSKNSS